MAVVWFENVRSVDAYYKFDPRVLLGINAVPNHNYMAKANTIGALLVLSPSIAAFIDVGPPWPVAPPQVVMVRLHTVRETLPTNAHVNNFCFGTISQITYANNLHAVVGGVPPAVAIIGVTPPANGAIATVHIEMDSWYFENYPLGFCTGMLCHEFAVHHLSDQHLFNLPPGGGVQLFNEAMIGGPVACPWPPNVNPATAGQRDHVFAACPGQPRHQVYRNVVIEVATGMVANIGVPAIPGSVPVTAGDATDLFRCYLMDVASIQATNDHRAAGVQQPSVVANCFNQHRLALLGHLGGGHPLLPFVPPPTTTSTVLGNFGYLASSVLWGFLPNFSKSWWGY